MGYRQESRSRGAVDRQQGRRLNAATLAAAALIVSSTVTGATVARTIAGDPGRGRPTVDAVVMVKKIPSPGTVIASSTPTTSSTTTTTAPVATTTTTAPVATTTTTVTTTGGAPVPPTTPTTQPGRPGNGSAGSPPSSPPASTTTSTTKPISAGGPRGVTPSPTTTTSTTSTTSTTTTTVPTRAAIATDCSTDVSAVLNTYLASLPDGAVFTSPASACYLVDEGVKITHPLTIVGGQFHDNANSVPARVPGRGAPSLHPIILIKETSDVTIKGVDLVGANPSGNYHAALVGQSGIDVRSSSNVTITDVTTLDTFGDGLTLFLAAGHGKDRNIRVDGLTITRAGRQGITPAFVSGATFSHVDIVSTADSAWDFESDLPTMGTGDITISYSMWKGRVNLIEPLTGPLTFNHDASSGSLLFDDPTNQPITVSNSTLLLPANDWGDPAAGVVLHGGTLTFANDVLGRQPSKKPPTGPAWHVTGTGHLSFIHTTVAAPLGSSTGSAVVTIVK